MRLGVPREACGYCLTTSPKKKVQLFEAQHVCFCVVARTGMRHGQISQSLVVLLSGRRLAAATGSVFGQHRGVWSLRCKVDKSNGAPDMGVEAQDDLGMSCKSLDRSGSARTLASLVRVYTDCSRMSSARAERAQTLIPVPEGRGFHYGTVSTY